MTSLLRQKNILLGLTGSIAAYKSADLTRRLRELGANVRVVMTDNAKRFITPLTMQAVSGFPVHDELFDLEAEAAMGHIELARWADLILVAPASADFMARLTRGHANDLLTTLCLASPAPIVIAPAMNQQMWGNALTQENVQHLKNMNIQMLGPVAGDQACGDVGFGRMMEPKDIVNAIEKLFLSGELQDLKVVITAGPTREPLDPVRFISNRSSGKMGYALAEAAMLAGAHVYLISGPTHLKVPENVTHIAVETADEMLNAAMRNIQNCDIFLAVAAVSDYRLPTASLNKIPKQAELKLALDATPDIVATVAKEKHPPFIVGFAAETDHVIESAQRKRERKGMDVIVANLVGKNKGMESDVNEVTYISEQSAIHLGTEPKKKLAKKLITLIAKDYQSSQKGQKP